MAGLPRIAPYPLPTDAELPRARAGWQIETHRAALLIHDMQHYFLRRFPEQESPLAPVIANIARLAEHARAVGIPVFYTAQRGNQDRRDRGLQADLWGPGMTASPEDQDIIPGLTPEPGDFVLVKHRYSAFQRSNLADLMRARQRDQLIITGVYAHIGCMLTAGEAFQLDIQPFLAADALADFSRQDHDLALDWVAGSCGVPLTTRTLIAALSAS
ncbi:isochorismatase family protein [Paracoccus sp. DMF-8]|uniref:isochorismatase family protein n=1 Tax=Paracoccus sp. DMF-8 TaxID=3019445 RepID=UPI0023E420BB|nr:isochorismatase family protein [Paracoccus sp. DMF-8]MDF3607751.1 isochorismatase family protein [Paracoccus sp. DMF-8]